MHGSTSRIWNGLQSRIKLSDEIDPKNPQKYLNKYLEIIQTPWTDYNLQIILFFACVFLVN